MKERWPKKTLGEICGFVRGPFGGSLTKSVFVADGFAVYEQQHAIYDQFEDIRYFVDDAKFKEMQRFELRPNDLIMSCSGTMGRVAIVPENIRRGIINQALLKLTPSKAVSPEFLKYWMDSSDFQDSLKEQSGGAAIQNVASVGILKEIQISLPSLPEQRRIVGILDEAFDDIATAKANAEKNLQNARALFESHLQSVFTQRGKGWRETPMGEVCDVKDGTHDSPKYIDDGIPFVTQKNIREDGLSFEKAKFIRQEDHDDFYRRSNVSYGDILISMIGANRGMACIVDDKRIFSIKNVGLVKQSPSINQQFLLHFLKSPQAASYVQAASKGGAQEFVGLTELRRFPVPLPSLERQNTLAENF
jgi:type I restriction enzyme S subunit